uniref:Variant surface glycoprotein 1390 n=1 Tax=Trypanosoma brucei TaxID=5691 RepID=M4T032_9TRYP|nr:variant surface glycoprotein 1390 [Trypanosoma brucei]
MIPATGSPAALAVPQQKQASRYLIVVVAAAMTTKVATAALEEGANAPAFHNLCTILAAADTDLAIGQETTTDKDKLLDTIHQLNHTFSDQSWQNEFKTAKGPGNWRDTLPEKYKGDAKWQEMYPTWLKAAKEAETDEENTAVKKIGAEGLSEAQKLLLRPTVQQLAARAHDIKNQLQSLAKLEQSDDAKGASKLLKEAAYGSATKTRENAAHTDIFALTCTSTATNCFKDDSSQKPPPTAAGVAMCLCAADGTKSKMCVNPQTALSNWNDPQSNHVAEWAKLRVYCSEKLGGDRPEEAINNALESLMANLHFNGNKLYLGAWQTGACRSGSGNAFCVSYTSDASKDASAVNKQPWVEKTRRAVAALRNSRQATAEAKQLKRQLTTIVAELAAAAQAAKNMNTKTMNTEKQPQPRQRI